MGSFITSHAMALTPRGLEDGNSFGPSLRKRSAASSADNPDGSCIDNSSAAEMVENLPSPILGKTTEDEDSRSMTGTAMSPV